MLLRKTGFFQRLSWRLALLFILVSSGLQAQDLQTTFSQDYSRWRYQGEAFSTVFDKSYDQWRYKGMTIRTVFGDDMNAWNIGDDVQLRTTYNNAFDRWTIRGNDMEIHIETTFFGDYTRWRVSGDLDGEMRTVFSNDFERWSVDVDFENVPEEIEAAVLFVALYASVRHSK